MSAERDINLRGAYSTTWTAEGHRTPIAIPRASLRRKHRIVGRDVVVLIPYLYTTICRSKSRERCVIGHVSNNERRVHRSIT